MQQGDHYPAQLNRKRGKRFPLFSVGYWMVAALYFVMVMYLGLKAQSSEQPGFGNLAGYGAVVGFSIGLIFGLFPIQNFPVFKSRRTFLSVVITGTIYYSLFFLAVIFVVSMYGNSITFASSYVFSPAGLMVPFHFSVSSALYHFILQVNKKFGPGVLMEYTIGKYFKPKEEERVFLFLDLKSSTTLAERLDHAEYSRMVSDCYAELTRPLLAYKARIYQYVGDEVVVSWKINRNFSADLCYEFFYAFIQRIEARKNHFLRNYGVYPRFKAGLHCGKVTVTQVGEIKTEIAYHGDVVNTASRIQSLCNQFQKELLVSESILEHLPQKDWSLVSFVANAALKGKEMSTRIFTINRPDQLALH